MSRLGSGGSWVLWAVHPCIISQSLCLYNIVAMGPCLHTGMLLPYSWLLMKSTVLVCLSYHKMKSHQRRAGHGQSNIALALTWQMLVTWNASEKPQHNSKHIALSIHCSFDVPHSNMAGGVKEEGNTEKQLNQSHLWNSFSHSAHCILQKPHMKQMRG